MKKVIAIAAVIVIALVGLTSYNGKTEVKKSGDDRLFAELKTGGSGGVVSNGDKTVGSGGGNDKKMD